MQASFDDLKDFCHQKTVENNFQNYDNLSSGHQSLVPIHNNSFFTDHQSELFLSNNQTSLNTYVHTSETLSQPSNNDFQMKELSVQPNISGICPTNLVNNELFENEKLFFNSKTENYSTVWYAEQVAKNVPENFINNINLLPANNMIKKRRRKNLCIIRSIMKFIELKLVSNNTNFAKNKLFQLFMFQIRGIYFCIENNMAKNKKFKIFYDNFKNLKANRDLEFLRITSFNQMKIIQKDFIEVISIIKHVLLNNSVELFRFQENNIVSGIKRTMKSLGVKNFSLQHNYEVFNEINNSNTDYNAEFKINIKNETNYSKIELKFTNGYPKRALSMCVHGQNAFILISNKFILNVFLIKLNSIHI